MLFFVERWSIAARIVFEEFKESKIVKLSRVGGLEHFLFSYQVGNVIILIDFHIFQRSGSSTNQIQLGVRPEMVLKHIQFAHPVGYHINFIETNTRKTYEPTTIGRDSSVFRCEVLVG